MPQIWTNRTLNALIIAVFEKVESAPCRSIIIKYPKTESSTSKTLYFKY